MSAPFVVGQRVRIRAVQHPCFAREIGQIEEVTRVTDLCVWCRPTRLCPRKTQYGIKMERACWETIRMAHELEPV